MITCRYFLNVTILLLLWINESLASPKMSRITRKIKAAKDKILDGYDKAIRPTEENSNTTNIIISLMPRQILQVDEEKALFILDSYIFMTWIDQRLMWNATEYRGFLQLPIDSIWKPDISVLNSHSVQVNPTQEVLVKILYNGRVFWTPPAFTQTSCPALMETVYPNGVINCTVVLGSWTHDGWHIDFRHSVDFYMREFVNINPRWELLIPKAEVIRNVSRSRTYIGSYLSIDAVFPLKRRMPPEIEATRNPCILIMLLTLSIFWLPANSSKKVLLGGILFLALTILLVYASFSTKFPFGVVFAVSFLQSAMYIVVITILLEVLVISNICNITGPVRPPPIAMQLLTGPFGKYACLRSSVHSITAFDRMQLKEESPESPTPKDDWMLFAAGLDRLFFVLMSIAMIAIYHL